MGWLRFRSAFPSLEYPCGSAAVKASGSIPYAATGFDNLLMLHTELSKFPTNLDWAEGSLWLTSSSATAREDRERASALAKVLETRGWSVWWDRAIPTGRRFDEVIDAALAEARSVMVLWSRVSIGRDWVLEEAEEGRKKGTLVPVLIDKVTLPRGFRRYQAADLSDWKGEDDSQAFQQLAEDIAAVIGAPPNAKAGSTESAEGEQDERILDEQPPHAQSRRRFFAALGIIGLALTVIFVMRLNSPTRLLEGDEIAVSIEPTHLMLVLGKDTRSSDPPVFNLTADFVNDSDDSSVVDQLDVEVTFPSGEARRFPLDQYYAHRSSTLMESVEGSKLVLSPNSTDQVGMQFRGSFMGGEYSWTPGPYRFDIYGWVDRDPAEGGANLAHAFQTSISNTHVRELERWRNADDSMWRDLNDPDNAVGIPVDIREIDPRP